MSNELNYLLDGMQKYCLTKAYRMPSPTDPAPQEWENAADDYVRKVLRTRLIEDLSPEAASAMLPRIACAFVAGSPTESSYIQASSFGDASATPERMLEFLLIDTWRDVLKPKWISGKIQMRQFS